MRVLFRFLLFKASFLESDTFLESLRLGHHLGRGWNRDILQRSIRLVNIDSPEPNTAILYASSATKTPEQTYHSSKPTELFHQHKPPPPPPPPTAHSHQSSAHTQHLDSKLLKLRLVDELSGATIDCFALNYNLNAPCCNVGYSLGH